MIERNKYIELYNGVGSTVLRSYVGVFLESVLGKAHGGRSELLLFCHLQGQLWLIWVIIIVVEVGYKWS